MPLSDIYEVLIEAAQAAAISASKWIGKQDNVAADQAAVSAMRSVFLQHNFPGKVVIGEGERDKAPMLYIGEQFSSHEPIYDIAVDPLEGTNLCAQNQPGAMSVLAVAPRGSLLHAPDLYMKKVATGKKIDPKLIALNLSFSQIIENVSKELGKSIQELKVVILNRTRHQQIIEEARSLGVVLELIEDGDVLAAINTCEYFKKSDLYYGIGGAPEGVLAAAALKTLGGQFLGQLIYPDYMDVANRDKIYSIEDLVKNDVVFVAAGVTRSNILSECLNEEKMNICNILICHYSRKLFRNITSNQILIG